MQLVQCDRLSLIDSGCSGTTASWTSITRPELALSMSAEEVELLSSWFCDILTAMKLRIVDDIEEILIRLL